MSPNCLKTRVPENYKFTWKVPFKTYRKYRPEYIEVETLLDLCSNIHDARPEPSYWHCSPEEVADWILEDTGHPEYKEAFIKNEIDGKSIIFLEADKFPRISIKQFDVIKVLTAKIQNLCQVDQDEFKRSISLPIRRPQTLYLWYKARRTGPTAYYMTPSKYFKLVHIIPAEQAGSWLYYTLPNHWNRIPSFIPYCPHIMIGSDRKVNPMTGTTQRQNFHPKDHPYLLRDNSLRVYNFPCKYEFPLGKDTEHNILKEANENGLTTCD